MCLIAFGWKAHPEHALVVAANRDEVYERPTLAAHWWDDASIFAGRDQRGGGTWMGVSRTGRFAALTNVRDPSRQRTDARSRGLLVSALLADPRPLPVALAATTRARDEYNGFTLLAAQWSRDDAAMQMLVASSGSEDIHVVSAGVHGLSNANLDTPWPKVVGVCNDLRAALRTEENEATLLAQLDHALDDRSIVDDRDLPSTGISLEWERALSARFIVSPKYGTRSSSALLMGYDGRVVFVERDATGARAPATARFAIA